MKKFLLFLVFLIIPVCASSSNLDCKILSQDPEKEEIKLKCENKKEIFNFKVILLTYEIKGVSPDGK